MKTIKLFLSIIFIAVSFISFGQAGGNVIYQENNRYIQNKDYNDFRFETNDNLYDGISDNEMIFSVKVLMNAKADSYLAIFNMIQMGETAEVTDKILNTRFINFQKELIQYGISENDIFMDMISLVPVYEYEVEKKIFSKTYNEVPKGFEMQKNIHVRYTKGEILDDIITIAAQNEIYDLVKVEYFVHDIEKVHDTIRQSAIRILTEKLTDFKQLNINFDTIYHVISENIDVSYPVDRYRSYQAYSGASLEAVNKKLVTEVRKPKTMFYNKIPYHEFDLIINSSFTEPIVQFSYELKAKYIIKAKTKTTQTKFMLLTPDGDLRTLKIE